MPAKLKKVVRERMALTRESYTTAMMRVRECDVDLRDPFAASLTIQQSPPRVGNLLIRRAPTNGGDRERPSADA